MPRKVPKWWPVEGPEMLRQIEALAAEEINRRRNRKPSRATIEKIAATKERNRLARLAVKQAEAEKRRKAKRLARRPPPAPMGYTQGDRCVKAMQPGEWYADRDLQNAVGVKEDFPVQVQASRRGWIERRRNPDWHERPPEHAHDPAWIPPPMWLYRLTAAGEKRKELLGLLG